ncbi:MAG: ribonuclease P protein component [Clostridia bacterium]|nr:ribonuclease P protein component [Clostridia bacterium]
MKKIKTLKMNYEFKNVLNRGKYFVNNQVIIYVLKNNLNYNRIGVVVGSKVCKATKRNHIKRLIREAYRKYEKELKQSYDIVMMWNKKTEISEVSFHKILGNMKKSFSKAGILELK